MRILVELDTAGAAGLARPDPTHSQQCDSRWCVAAFDSPARQTFVSELVGEDNLSNAVALNSTSFNIARTIGPAVAGALIAAVGTGWVFLINAASFVAVLTSLGLLRVHELHHGNRARPSQGSAPIVGWVADAFGPRWALGVGAASGLGATIVAICYLHQLKSGKRSLTSQPWG